MKEWWNNLALREKQMVSIGVIVVAILLGYLILWSPLDDKVISLRKQILRDQELLTWMKSTDQQIQKKEKATPSSSKSSGSLLAVAQKQLNQSELKSLVSQLKQSEGDAIQLTFYKVDFDKLVQWLIKFTQQENAVIKQATLTASATPGVVAADVVISG